MIYSRFAGYTGPIVAKTRPITVAVVLVTFVVCVFLAAVLGAEQNEGPKNDGIWHTEYYRGHSYVMCVDTRLQGGIFHDPDCKCTRRKYTRMMQVGESRAVRDSLGLAIETR